MQQIEPDEAKNPFSLSNVYGMKSNRKHQSMTNLRNNYDDLINTGEVELQKDNSFSDDDDMTSDTSSVSDADY